MARNDCELRTSGVQLLISLGVAGGVFRVAVKLDCGGGQVRCGKYKVSLVDCCCVKFLTAKITSNFNMPKTISSKLWPAAK